MLPRLSGRVVGLLVVIIAFWLPRGLALDRFVTPDESYWLARSANFSQALAHGELTPAYQYFHPGVTTMWLGSLGLLWKDPHYAREASTQVRQPSNVIVPVLRARGVEPIQALAAGRAAVVLAGVLILAGAYWYAARVFGLAVAVAGLLLLAFDPFHAGLSRLLHVDGLASSLTLLSLLAMLSAIHGQRRRRDILISGAVAGLAWLTRSTTLVLVPVAGFLLTSHAWQARSQPLAWRDRLRHLAQPMLLWSAAGVLVVIALWPAMWVHPVGTVRNVLLGALHSAEAGHRREVYFNGAVHAGDPGWSFYPITFLWRTTPAVMLGLLAAVVILLWPRSRPPAPVRRAILVLLVFAGLFMLFMSLGAKKFDRYALPAYGPLDLAAGWGLVEALRHIAQRGRLASRLALLAGGVLIAGSVTEIAASYPYYLSAYNPVLGGNAAARSVMMVGWGEGLDQVGRFLWSQRNAADLRVRTSAWPQPLSYFFPGHLWQDNFTPDEAGVIRWATTDFYVLDITSLQRGWIPPALLAFFDAQRPVFVARIGGSDYARVYDVRTLPVPDYFHAPATRMSDWNHTLRIVATDVDRGPVLRGDRVPIAVYVEELASPASSLALRVRLVSPDGRDIVSHTVAIRQRRRTVWRVGVPITIPRAAATGPCRVLVSVINAETGAALPAMSTQTGDRLESEQFAGVLMIADPRDRLILGLSP